MTELYSAKEDEEEDPEEKDEGGLPFVDFDKEVDKAMKRTGGRWLSLIQDGSTPCGAPASLLDPSKFARFDGDNGYILDTSGAVHQLLFVVDDDIDKDAKFYAEDWKAADGNATLVKKPEDLEGQQMCAELGGLVAATVLLQAHAAANKKHMGEGAPGRGNVPVHAVDLTD